MTVLTWNESLSLGVISIDAEHEAMLGMLNAVLDPGGDLRTARDAVEFVDRLLGFAIAHFGHEEALMQRIGYPELDSHRRAHVKLREQSRYLRSMLEEEGNPALGRLELAGFLADWLSDHLAGMDMQLRPHIARHVALNGPIVL